MQLESRRGRRFLLLNVTDNVATLLDDNLKMDCLENNTIIQSGIPFGHKVSLSFIAKGSPIVKYGVEIGTATKSIEQGEHVHVHNCK
tara:strand:- start:5310 stop:5570 length:261 start_codon:yes stop_codon:yes gene_type:complete